MIGDDIIATSEFTIVISDQQQNKLRSEIYQLIMSEVKKVREDAAIGARYLKKKDLCDYLQIANNTLDNWIAQGLPVIIVGGCVRFDRPAVDDWLKNRADELNR
ncbi:helix-turn-helix transcriptional regulator [Loigolactobacillus coryniformis]|uniref:helix-turn-helix transcriptional regulator n=1 Tax=Loigolactobacillus coryniformis TaxID=1610 RepID=UPI00070502B1|nr:helix-turn-helix domain-containing protein [Loigolactobacillus coryniformis]